MSQTIVDLARGSAKVCVPQVCSPYQEAMPRDAYVRGAARPVQLEAAETSAVNAAPSLGLARTAGLVALSLAAVLSPSVAKAAQAPAGDSISTVVNTNQEATMQLASFEDDNPWARPSDPSRPQPAPTPVQPTPRIPLDSTAREIVSRLVERRALYAVAKVKDSDAFGKRLSTTEAIARLEEGKGVVVRSAIGSPGDFRQFLPVTQADVARHMEYEGVRVNTGQELARLNAVEGLTSIDTSSSLTAEERENATLLRRYEGGIPSGTVTREIEWTPIYTYPTYPVPGRPWPYPSYPYPYPSGYYTTYYHFSADAPQPALYSQTWKGGFLGIGRYQDRITAHEAMSELKAGRPLTVISPAGVKYQVETMDSLKRIDSGR